MPPRQCHDLPVIERETPKTGAIDPDAIAVLYRVQPRSANPAAIDKRRQSAKLARMTDPRLLIVWHSRTGAAQALARAAASGAGATVLLMRCEEIQPEHLLEASGYLFVCPENLGAMTGAMKEMFDRCYYPVLGQIEGRAYATMIAAGSDGQGAERQIDRICTGWRLRRAAEPVIVGMNAQAPEAILAPKVVPPKPLEDARTLGAALAEGLAQGIF